MSIGISGIAGGAVVGAAGGVTSAFKGENIWNGQPEVDASGNVKPNANG